MAFTCPSCGKEIPIPKRKAKSAKCPYCKTKFKVERTDEEETHWEQFKKEHPKAAMALGKVILHGCDFGLFMIDNWDDLSHDD